MRGKLNTLLQSLFFEIIVTQEGWPLVSVTIHRGTIMSSQLVVKYAFFNM